MHVVQYKYVDCFDGGEPGGIREILDKYNIPNEVSDAPDYIIHFPYSNEFLNYDCVRIFWTGENISPDFNLSDYAIGFDYLNYGDRYFRYPLYMSYAQDWQKAIKKHAVDLFTKKECQFCNFVYSNDKAAHEREDFYELLSKYKKIDSGGRYKNNIGYLVDDKYTFQKNINFQLHLRMRQRRDIQQKKLYRHLQRGQFLYIGEIQ